MTTAATGPAPTPKKKKPAKAKRERKTLPRHDGIRPFEAPPDGFDFAVHAPLSRKDFANAALWAQHQASRMVWRAQRAGARADAAVAKQKDDAAWGDDATRKAIKRLRSVLADLKALCVDQSRIAVECGFSTSSSASSSSIG